VLLALTRRKRGCAVAAVRKLHGRGATTSCRKLGHVGLAPIAAPHRTGGKVYQVQNKECKEGISSGEEGKIDDQ
jgi:hypothetical protein